MKILAILLAVAFSAPDLVSGVRQTMEIFSQLSCQGDSILITNKEPDLTNYREFLNTAQSWKGSGYFTAFSSPNYERYAFFYTDMDGSQRCWNQSRFPSANSLRYHGPEDTATEAVAIYGGDSGYVMAGEEIIIYEEEGTKFGFTPTWLTTFGTTDWTIYENEDYTGRQNCLKAWDQVSDFDPGTQGQFRSIKKGCPKNEDLN